MLLAHKTEQMDKDEHSFRRVKLGQKPGFPVFKKKGIGDSFAMREKPKFDVDGRAALLRDLKRTQESGKAATSVGALAMTT